MPRFGHIIYNRENSNLKRNYVSISNFYISSEVYHGLLFWSCALVDGYITSIWQNTEFTQALSVRMAYFQVNVWFWCEFSLSSVSSHSSSLYQSASWIPQQHQDKWFNIGCWTWFCRVMSALIYFIFLKL